ncbi:MAG TPA: recombinase family protein, partial [Aggregatilineales bacterium]|nr:recombinase family protein [Aggregatilineales bacterium]
MMEGINELFDEYYLHQLRFWTTLGKKTRAQKGMWNGTLPFGYQTDEETGKPVAHPMNANGVRLAFEAYSTGQYCDREIAELLNREGYRTSGNWGVRPFTKDTVNRVLRNEFYLGFVKYKGELYPGEHPPLVDKELFDKCQEVRAGRRVKSRAVGETRRIYMFSGIARCHECGLTLRCVTTGSTSKSRYYRHTANERGYECSVPSKFARADSIEPQWAEIVGRIRLPEDWRRRVEELAGNGDQRTAVLRERQQVEEKLRRLKRLYRDLIIDDAEYKSSLEELQRKLHTLVLPSDTQVVQAGEYLENLALLWEAATLKEQRDITRILLKAAYVNVIEQRIVAIEPKPVFRWLLVDICDELDIEIV